MSRRVVFINGMYFINIRGMFFPLTPQEFLELYEDMVVEEPMLHQRVNSHQPKNSNQFFLAEVSDKHYL